MWKVSKLPAGTVTFAVPLTLHLRVSDQLSPLLFLPLNFQLALFPTSSGNRPPFRFLIVRVPEPPGHSLHSITGP